MSAVHIEKKAKLAGEPLVIGTHSGTFHCDEALAVFMLKLLPQYKDASVVRTRDPATLDTCDIVVDVGGVYDESVHRYDHHQRGFTEVFGQGFNTKLSSAGLVYKHFGKDILSQVTSVPVSDPSIQTLHLKLYEAFIEAIDGIDNGVSQYVTSEPARYRSSTDLSSRVGGLNPRWNEKSDNSILDEKFQVASALTGSEFLSKLSYLHEAWLPARSLVQAAFEKRTSVHPSGKVIVFEDFAPWKEHLFNVEEDAGIKDEDKPLYVLYPDEAANAWRIQAIPKSGESFESRKAMPEPWRGVRDQELSGLIGIDGCIFCHAAGFIGGNKTFEGALKMADASLAYSS
ncbi:Predicted metal-binding protein [Phaffia rhodozyma]|uniref:Predicted metal-binding protein n=1 Tax=Phaffia rhodozyma TaxID=264483 RepID=A0A0F7SPG7_PHARH|nr:Predicted metal-binding protein [Phaffia rhodozyma]